MFVISRIQDTDFSSPKVKPLFVTRSFEDAISYCVKNVPEGEDPQSYRPVVDCNRVYIYADWENAVLDYFEVVEVKEL